MKQQLIWTLIALVTVSTVNGQSILKKKEVSTKLDHISTNIQNKEFEKAMTIFYNEKEIISEDKVKKGDRDQYNKIMSKLEERKIEFDRNNEKVNAYQKQYDSAEYCSAIDLLDLSLNKENSYKETRDAQNKLRSSLTRIKQKCEENSNNILQWKKDYKNQDYEKLYGPIDISFSEKKYFYSNDLSELEVLHKKIKDKYEVYNSVKLQTITAPEEKMNSFANFNTLTYEQSEKYIQELTTILRVGKSEIEKLEGFNPILMQRFADLEPEIKNNIVDLQEFSDLNKPLSNQELMDYLTNQTIKLSIEQIFKYFDKIDQSLIMYDEYSEMPEFQSILELNVYEYFDLQGRYNSELGKQVFEKTDDYQNYRNELERKRKHILENFYYHMGLNRVGGEKFTTSGPGYFIDGSEDFSVNYDLKKKGFPITIGKVLPYHCSGSFMPKTISHLEFPNIPTTKVYDCTTNSENSYREIFLISVSEETALEMENNRSNIEILWLFQIKGIEERQLNDIDFKRDNRNNYGCEEPVDVVATKSLRLIVYNKSTNNIYFDKMY